MSARLHESDNAWLTRQTLVSPRRCL